MKKEIKAPNQITDEERSKNFVVFLAGSIEMGKAENWQEKVKRIYPMEDNVIFLNPRRDDWDSSWVQSINNPQFREQVEWELFNLEICNEIILYFDPKTKSPISLLELGLFANSEKLKVICPDGFWRKGNVEIVCRRYEIPLFNSLEEAFPLN